VDLFTQAKLFIAKQASKLAMVAVPLAVLAVARPAKATSVALDPSGSDVCTSSSLSGSCILTTNPTGGNPFMNQVVLTGTSNSSGGSAFLDMPSSTTNGGTLPIGNVPVSWDFAISGLRGGQTVEWDVRFNLYYGDGFDFTFFSSGTTGNGEVTGGASISITAAEAINGYFILVEAGNEGTNFTLSAPLTVNSSSSAPEPGSMFLMGAGGAALLVVRRKKA